MGIATFGSGKQNTYGTSPCYGAGSSPEQRGRGVKVLYELIDGKEK